MYAQDFHPHLVSFVAPDLDLGQPTQETLERWHSLCEEEGEFSVNALNALAELNGVGRKFNTLADDLFRRQGSA